jgi:uncharacterized repeat protein (TIGR01451 family)
MRGGQVMKGKLLAFGVSVLAMATIGVVQLQTKAVDGSRDCDQYAVIRCGALSQSELKAEYDSNNTAKSNGSTAAQNDIKKVFSAMGISRSDLNLTAKNGVVYKDGTVKVGSEVVATGAQMAARGLGGSQIAGTSAQRVSVSAMSDAQTAMVFYKNGKFAFAVMKPCGNPVKATPKNNPPAPEPKAECVGLDVTKQERTKYLVKARASTSGGAKVKAYTLKVFKGEQVIYNNTYKNTTNEQSVMYNVTEPGKYRVKVSIDTTEGVKSGPKCEATFTVKEAPTQPNPAVDITKHVDEDKKYLRVNANVEFTYRLAVKNTGEVDLKNVVVTDTPDAGVTLISAMPTDGEIKDNTFTYTIPTLRKGETRIFTLTAKVPVAQAGKITNTACVDAPEVDGNPDKCDTADVEVPPTPVPGKIEVCVLADNTIQQIEETDYNPELHSKDYSDCEEQETPVELPRTGPVETVLSTVGAMSLVGASAYYVASRRHI